ncbi:helix-turn-helix domain-containing protein [Mesorhizobium sp. Pch-S]|uniref:helix-turn-helix domain-containing protein n=1 Tax=Mesorhizobium sp. Pch-S TaxID=2082387 RepID=UPI0013EA1EFE|nr:helix-turn-helix domain-containing protein [Mesorhizobium sp. Pch-S]
MFTEEQPEDLNRIYTKSFLQEARKKGRAELRRVGTKKCVHRGMPQWAIDIVQEIAERLGACISDIADSTRTSLVVAARNEAMYRVKERKPSLSSTQIGKWFGRDHTSVLFAIASYQEATGADPLVGYNINIARRRNAALRAVARKRDREAAR